MRHLRQLALALSAATLIGCASARDRSGVESPITTEPTAAVTTAPALDHHTLVLLVLSDAAPRLDLEAAADLQVKHLRHIASLVKSGKVHAAGPFSNRDDEAYRGILIFRGSMEEARALCADDPAVLAGRLKVVCQTWNVPKGSIAFPTAQR